MIKGLPDSTSTAGFAQLLQLDHGLIEVLARQRSHVHLCSIGDQALFLSVSRNSSVVLESWGYLGNHQAYARATARHQGHTAADTEQGSRIHCSMIMQ